MKNRIICALLCSTLILSGCSSSPSTTGTTSENTPGTEMTATSDEKQTVGAATTDATVTTTAGIDVDLTGDYSDTALNAAYEESSATKIIAADGTVTIDGTGASEEQSVITITEGGTYIVSGTIEEGQIIVNLSEDENVQLVLAGAVISNSTQAPIVALSAKNLFLTLAEGTENSVVDGRAAAVEETQEENTKTESGESTTADDTAAIYSKCDLIINGTGSLAVTAGYKDGITGKDDLEIISGTIAITAGDDGVVGKDSVSINDGTLQIQASGDGIKSSNDEDTTKGYVVIDGGNISIAAGDDGIHSQTVLVINGGTIKISESEEGLESLNIVINDGTVDIVSTDDGINISDGSSSGMAATEGGRNGGQKPDEQRMMQNEEGTPPEKPEMLSDEAGSQSEGEEMPPEGAGTAPDEAAAPAERTMKSNAGRTGTGGGMDAAIDGALIIHGGSVTVDASGDGIDSNGSMLMTGGTVTVYGSADGANAALDYNGAFVIDGGTLYAIGTSAMAQSTSENSSQHSIIVSTEAYFDAGSEIIVSDSTGDQICSITSRKNANNIVISTPDLVEGENYTVNAGENSVNVTP